MPPPRARALKPNLATAGPGQRLHAFYSKPRREVMSSDEHRGGSAPIENLDVEPEISPDDLAEHGEERKLARRPQALPLRIGRFAHEV